MALFSSTALAANTDPLWKELNSLEQGINKLNPDNPSTEQLAKIKDYNTKIQELFTNRDTHYVENSGKFIKKLVGLFKQNKKALAKVSKALSTTAQSQLEQSFSPIQNFGFSANVSLETGFTPNTYEYAEIDKCETKQPAVPNDYFYKKSKSSAIQQVGFTRKSKSAWNIEDGSSHPVIVAVIDSGLDWNHQDFDKDNLWINPGEIPRNGKDDDHNGFVDDIIGWNFIANNNKPWDDDGHGTFVTGIIAAKQGNKVGIAGINKGAKIMVLKVLNVFGHSRASLVAEAIFYAARQGAKVINVSIGGQGVTRTQQEAINYAHNMGALVIMAAGNEATDTSKYSSGLNHVLTVAAVDKKNKRLGFSNYGQQVDIAAPGKDIISLRARRTDLMASVAGEKYKIGKNYLGKDKRYFHASGTSFSAPIVAGSASLIWAHNPSLSNDQVRNMLLNSAKDIETPGWDNLTGYGLLDATAALKADPDYFSIAKIRKVAFSKQGGKAVIAVYGSVDSSDFNDAWLEIGYGNKPKKWKKISTSIRQGIKYGRMATFPIASNITKRGKWIVRLLVKTNQHGILETRKELTIN